MADLALQPIPDGGEVTTAAATGGGDTVPSGANAAGWSLPVVLFVVNGDVSPHTVTVDGQPAVVVPAGSQALIPVSSGVYGARKSVTYDGVTSVEVGAAALAAGVASG